MTAGSDSYQVYAPDIKLEKGHIMFSRTHAARGNETNRFSATYTLSDFPLLIGEILRRSERRSEQKARARLLLQKIRAIFTVR